MISSVGSCMETSSKLASVRNSILSDPGKSPNGSCAFSVFEGAVVGSFR
uniref:Uncharacterized protein n=1 Tax=Anopheles atroparvus TaxID=41427 RepID=A0AAG5DCD2_ANOAO